MARGTLKNLKRSRPAKGGGGGASDNDPGLYQDDLDLIGWLNCECFFSLMLVALLAALPFNLHSAELYQTRESYVYRAEEMYSEGEFFKAAALYERAVDADETAEGRVYLAETLVGCPRSLLFDSLARVE